VPQSGRVRVLGQPPGTDARLLRRRIGYHPEDDVLLPAMTGVASVTLCAQLSGLPRADALRRAHEMLYFVGLGEVRYRQAETYSQGMRQRLKLAQALVHDPELLILDEPTNGLDPRGRQEMLDLVRDLSRNKGIRIVLSSHLLPDVEAVCDQVAVLEKGRLVQSGRLDDLLRGRPSAFELRLKGSRDAFEAALRAAGGDCQDAARGFLRVVTPAGGARPVFEAALRSDCQIRHLVPERQTLSELFSDSIRGAPARADS
jgi:ABC-2 type transport system ATP-binding protein